MKYQNFVTRFSFPYFDMPVVANGFELRERPDDKLPYDPQRMRAPEVSTAELRQVPEAPAPTQADGIAAVERIEPESAIAPDADDTQNLILRG